MKLVRISDHVHAALRESAFKQGKQMGEITDEALIAKLGIKSARKSKPVRAK